MGIKLTKTEIKTIIACLSITNVYFSKRFPNDTETETQENLIERLHNLIHATEGDSK